MCSSCVQQTSYRARIQCLPAAQINQFPPIHVRSLRMYAVCTGCVRAVYALCTRVIGAIRRICRAVTAPRACTDAAPLR